MKPITPQQNNEINFKLIQGAVSRASQVSLYFAVGFVLYGFQSIDIVQKFDPDISLWSNVWPRIAFNGLPFLLMHFYLKKYKEQTVLKLWVWSIGFPAIFLAACFIHVCPLILSGHPDIYPFVHAVNTLVLILGIATVAPPPRFLLINVSAVIILFIAPLSAILIFIQDMFLLKFFVTDMFLVIFYLCIGSQINFALRKKLATEDVINKSKIGKFIGNMVSESIFENNDALLQPRRKEAFLMSMDIRGFTEYTQQADISMSSIFKEKYHALVATAVGEGGGFIHKTHGDGHLISIGLMTEDVDLSDLPGLEGDLKKVTAKRQHQRLENGVKIFEKVFRQFEQLKYEMSISQNICVCAAIDHGDIGLKVLGDPNVRLEFDIEGMTVIRCSRLEAYTKTLRQILVSNSSFLVVSAAAAKFLPLHLGFQTFQTEKSPIKDFPDETRVFYIEFKPNKIKKAA
jgi:class 3 adenylate cyclase